MWRALGPDRMLGVISTMLVWALYFVALYVLQAIGCDLGWTRWQVAEGVNLLTAVLVGLAVVTLGIVGWLSHVGWRAWNRARTRDYGTEMSQRARFMGMAMCILGMLSGVATILVAVPVVMLHPCMTGG